METHQGTPISCPYEIGAKFHLRVSPLAGAAYDAHVTVEHAFTPFTISPVMRVSLDDPRPPVDLPPEMILKVYDRRFAPSLREYYKGKPPTYESEAQYHEYLASGPAADPDELDNEISSICPNAGYEGCPPHLFEHLISFAISPYYENECAAYESLASLQGQHIPVFYGAAEILDGGLDEPMRGVLLEVVSGVSLDKADPASIDIDKAVRNAMRIVDSYYDLGLLNEDIHLGNFIVRPDNSVVMIDFAQSRLREEDESDEDWREAKSEADEEGCIGFKAKKKFGWPWVRGQKYYSRLTESDEIGQTDETYEVEGTNTAVEGEPNGMDLDDALNQPNEQGRLDDTGRSSVAGDSEASESEEMSNWSGASGQTTTATSVATIEDASISYPYDVEPNILLTASSVTGTPAPDDICIPVADVLEGESGEVSQLEGVDQLDEESESEGTRTPIEGKSNEMDLWDQSNLSNAEEKMDSTSESGLMGDSEMAGGSDGASGSGMVSEMGGVLSQTTDVTSAGNIDGIPIQCPYVVGAKLRLELSPSGGTPCEVHVTILDAFAPFTISPVMRVSLDSNPNLSTDLPHQMILKVYDRRFAHSLREYYKGKPATYESEAQYQHYLASGPAVDPEELDNQISEVCPAAGYEGCPPHLFEHLIAFAISPYYDNECAAYERLASLQGRDMPVFYGSVNVLDLDVDPPVQGVLLEVVPGVSLDKADPASIDIDKAVRNAMRIVDSYYDLGLLNEDIHLGNFIVRRDNSVVMIDFAQSRLREEDESDEDWREAKSEADEEGCIGFKAKKKFGWPWIRGQKYYSRLTEPDDLGQLEGEGESNVMDLVEETSQSIKDGKGQPDGTTSKEGAHESGEIPDQVKNDASVESGEGIPIPHLDNIGPNISPCVTPAVNPEPDASRTTDEDTFEGESQRTSTPMESESNGVDFLDELNQAIGEDQSNGTSQSDTVGDLEATSDPDGVGEPEGKTEPGGMADQTTSATTVGTVKGTPIRHWSSVGLNMSLVVPQLHKMHTGVVGGQRAESDEVD